MASHHTQANRLSIEALLNCFLREVALPNRWLSFTPTPLDGYLAELRLPAQNRRLFFHVHAVSTTANYHYLTLPAYSPNDPELDLDELTDCLLTELCQLEGQAECDELMAQIRCSRDVMSRILEASTQESSRPTGVVDTYVHSEQALTVGHRYHPTPKARQGMSEQALLDYSPEHGARFQWHCFSVPREDLKAYGQADLQSFIRQQWMGDLDVGEDRALLPVHPWQAGYLTRQSDVQAGLREGWLVDHGPAGQALYATSSLRSCYHPDLDFMVKGSLNVRLTNCVRKNALYELDTAVALSDALKPMASPLRQHGFSILFEPAYQSLGGARDVSRDMIEGFSFIARDNRFRDDWLGHRPVVAGALFAPRPGARPWVRDEIIAAGERLNTSYFNTALAWFEALLEVLVEPVIRLYVEHGVVLEPHLQNGVIGLQRHWPAHYYYRDMEGTKLVPEHWPASQLADLSERALESIYYDADRGWNRVCYCLFVNTLAQAVFYISGDDELLERSLWRVLAEYLGDLSRRMPEGRDRIQSVLQSAHLPNKANLLVRFRQQADRHAGYVPMANPIRQACNPDVAPASPSTLDAAV